MMDITDAKWSTMSDSAIVHTLGAFVKHHRLTQNLTQGQLAEDAGINRSTLSEFENGMRPTLLTFIQLLRPLGLLHALEPFRVQQQLSPLQLAKLEQEQRKRAGKAGNSDKNLASDW